jgi:hypothetical protein
MEKLCQWLEIPWNDSLLESTINGKQWWNEKNTLPISGFSSSIAAQRFEDFIPAFDRFRLEALVGFKSRVWGYSQSWWRRSTLTQLMAAPLILLPFRLESLSIDASIAAVTPRPSLKNRLSIKIPSIVRGRKLLLKAWFFCLRRGTQEVELL